MTSKTIANGILKAVSIIAGIFLLLYFLYKIQIVLVYIGIAAIISLIGRPIVRMFKQHLKFGNTLAVVTTMILMVGFFIGLISMFIPLIAEQGRNLSLLNVEEIQGSIENLYNQISAYFDSNNIDLEKSLQQSNFFESIDFSVIPAFFDTIVSGFGNFSIGFFSVLFISFFLLKDSKLFVDGLLVFVPIGKERRMERSFDKIKDLLSRYFIGLSLQIMILFIIYTIALLAFGINNAIVIAFLCALLNLIPYLGPLFSGALMTLLCLTSNLESDFNTVILPNTIGVMVIFLVGQLIDNFISQPYIFSSSVKSHPLEIFLVIIIWGLLFGILGMVVAVPSYTALKVIFKEFWSEYKIVKSLTRNL